MHQLLNQAEQPVNLGRVGDGPMVQPADCKESETMMALKALQRIENRFFNIIPRLEAKLSFVLRPEVESDPNKVRQANFTTELANNMMGFCIGMDGMADALESIIERCEL